MDTGPAGARSSVLAIRIIEKPYRIRFWGNYRESLIAFAVGGKKVGSTSGDPLGGLLGGLI